MASQEKGKPTPYPYDQKNLAPTSPINWNTAEKLNIQSNTFTTQHNKFKMQAALCISPTLLPLIPTKSFSQATISPPPKLGSSLVSRRSAIKAADTSTNDASTYDYSSAFSVFPAEACETIGGDACSAEMYPEVKLKTEAENGTPKLATESIDREYLEYDEAKTVFKAEACDDLGGTFCDREYQRGVY